jgi:methionyl-tRNA formyltransferase
VTIPPPAEIGRVAYLGTPTLAVGPLTALVDAGYEVPLVVSRADTRRGRGGEHHVSPVKAAAQDLGLRVTDDLSEIHTVSVDLGVVVAYGRIIPATTLDRLAMVNLHFSLLPRWRGAAPVERAILAGDPQTGVCLMAVEEGLDTGGVYRRDVVDIDDDESLEELRGRLVEIGTGQLLDALATGFGDPAPQVGDPVHAAKILSDESRIDWTQSAVDIHRRVRVGGAFTTFRDRRLKIHRAAPVDGTGVPGSIDGLIVFCGTGALRLIEVQPEGKVRQPADSWRNGAQPGRDDRLR